jgi:methionine-S-sulfoxide reductase
MKNLSIFLFAFIVLICGLAVSPAPAAVSPPESLVSGETQTATFAGGCFWCVEADFEKVEGVIEVISGYTGGDKANPKYKEVATGGTGHVEAVQVIFDPNRVTYLDLLSVFWRHVDPTDSKGQFVELNTDLWCSMMARISASRQNDQSRRLSSRESSTDLLSQKYFRLRLFTQPRNIIRITIRRTQFGTDSIAITQVVTSF